VLHTSKSSQVNAYLDQRMNAREKKLFEAVLSECPETSLILKKKQAHLEFITDLIPNEKLSTKAQQTLVREFSDINKSLLARKEETIPRKIYHLLTKPIIEF
jgi:hypothetical protein